MLLLDQGNLLQYNLYAYCFNNPVNYSDSTGYLPQKVIKVVNGLSASAIFARYASGLYTAFAATMAKISLYVTGVLLPKIASIFWWQPWLVAGILVAAVAIVTVAVVVLFNKHIAYLKSKVPSKLKNGDKVKTPDSHPKEYTKNKGGSGYTHNNTGWKAKKDPSNHGGPHWDMSPPRGSGHINVGPKGNIFGGSL